METHTKYRMQLLDGKLYMPSIEKIRQIYGKKIYSKIENMFESAFHQYLLSGTTGTISLPYWAKKINNPTAMNIALKLLSQHGWITSVSLPDNNWSEMYINESKLLEYLTQEELASVRRYYKFSKYLLKQEDTAEKNNIVRLNGKKQETGLVREGFRKTGNTTFQFDIDTMETYQEEIIALVNKGIDKMAIKYPSINDDLANYGSVGEEIIEHYIWNNGKYSAGQNTIDSRGRNISGMLNKIGNPIGFKIMRSLLIIPEPNRNIATKVGLRNKYLFIAELLGYKNGNLNGKVNFGRKAYYNRTNLDYETMDIDDLYEYIWIERMYKELDDILDMNHWKKKLAMSSYHTGSVSMTETSKKIETFTGKRWYVSIEIDIAASVILMNGLILNHAPFIERCNAIGNTLSDPWNHDVITNRIQMKTIMQRMYGSSTPADQMWQRDNIKFTTDEVIAFEKELETGSLAVADKFKDFVIQNAKPQEQMEIKLNNQSFKVKCNKHYNVGDITNSFDFYDTNSNSIRRIHNTDTISKPDLRSFKLYFQTLLIHGLDGQIMDNASDAVMDAYDWLIDIHDALILDAEATDYARDIYCSGRNPSEPSLEQIHRDRNTILSEYFTSIGIAPHKVKDWNTDVKPLIEPYSRKLKVNRICLK